MTARLSILLSLWLIGAATPASADTLPDGLSVSGSVRLRAEAIENQGRTGFNADDSLVNLRTQIKVAWKHENLRLVTEVYDSRVWGANSGTPLTTNEVNAFEPVQAYLQADLGNMLGKGTATQVQAGRFTLDLGSRRLVSNDDYRNSTTGFTGIRADVVRGATKATLIYVLPQIRLPDDGTSLRKNAVEIDKESFATVLWGGMVARQSAPGGNLVEAVFLHFGERDSPGHATRDRSLNNLGLRVIREPAAGRFDWGLEGIYQWGQISASLTPRDELLPVSATFGRAHLGYSFATRWRPRALLELDRASGDGTGHTYSRFDPLFGMRRGDFAPGGLYSAISRSNLFSPGIRLEVTPTKRLDAFVGYRALWLADSHDAFSTTGVKDVTGGSGSFAGHQIDFRLRDWLIVSKLRLEIDGVYLARERFLTSAPNGRKGDVRYASCNLTGYF